MNASQEVWRPIPQFEGRYEVSNIGRVRSLPKIIIRKGHGVYLRPEAIMTNVKTPFGYFVLKLRNEGKDFRIPVHRLVAMAFIPNPNNYPIINHKNGIKTDNRVENLEWCTHKMNTAHAWRIGLAFKSQNSGTPKIPILITNITTQEELSFDSIHSAARYICARCNSHLHSVVTSISAGIKRNKPFSSHGFMIQKNGYQTKTQNN